MITVMRAIMTIAIAMAMSGAAYAQTIVGLPAISGNGNCFPFGCAFNDRYQQVYTASAFAGPITISSLQFYNTSFDSGATAMNSGTWTISLSTTSSDWNTLSSSFAANVGGDNTTVFSGNLSQSWTFGNTLNIALSNPFTYNPGVGNLLLDVMVSGASEPGGSIFFDANLGGSVVGRNFGGIINYDYGLVTGFNNPTTQPVPEPETYAMMLAGLGLLGLMAHRRKQQSVA